MLKLIRDFGKAAHIIFSRNAPLPLTIYPRLIADMGKDEQDQIRSTLTSELQSLAPLLQRFENELRIRLTLEPHIDASALVNAFHSSIVTADKVKDRRSIREEKTAAGTAQIATIYGLAALLENVRSHVASRDDIDYTQEGRNRIGQSFIALQDDGAIVSSVGANSLMELRQTTKELWAIDPAFWAVTHGTAQNIKDAYETQYTARYHSPQILRILLETQLEWLLDHPRELNNLGDKEKRAAIQKKILEEAFFPKLQVLYNQHAKILKQLNPEYNEQAPRIERITADKDAAIPPLPTDIIAQDDHFRILAFYVPEAELARIAPPNGSVYVTLETRNVLRIEGKHATKAHIKVTPVTCLARRSDAVFSGHYGELAFAPCVHNDAGHTTDQGAKINLFVQMKNADDGEHGFTPLGAPGGLFEKFGGFVGVGHKVYAVVDRDLIDPVVKEVKKAIGNPKLAKKITPNWVIVQLVNKGLISYVNADKLRDIHADREALSELVADLSGQLAEGQPSPSVAPRPTNKPLRRRAAFDQAAVQ